MELKEIQDLIKFVAKSGVSEVEIESKGFKITIKTPPGKKGSATIEQPVVQTQMAVPAQVVAPVQASPQPAAQPAAEKEEKPAPKEADNTKEFPSPMIGTFYRSSSPEKPPFVNVGDEVKKGDILCIIEAMKLFNEIEAEYSGKIVKVLVDDSSPVEYEQPLFLIEPH